ncbi:MAG: sigma 54-interacting transcriptional regulator, partial [Bacillota bacterium]|nr:sigma 54-interacting transcriptional regulator [Bacillota bacterium]
MIFQLKEIQGFLQELIDTVSALINAELIIVDVNLIVLAGTKKYHHLIGERAIPYIYNALFNRKDIIVIENPMEHEICSDCKEREACSEFAGINTPLFVDGEVIGGLSIAALNPEQKRYLIEYKKNYIDFSRKMVDLIQSKIKSYTLTKELDFTTRMFNSIINNSNQGIVLIDNSNRIRVVNDYFCEMFNIHSDDVVGKPFEEVYRNEFIRNMVYQGKEFDTIEASVSVSEKNFRVVHSGRHIRIDENLNGFLLFLKDIKSVSYMLNSLMVNKEDITFDEIVGESAELHQVKKKALSVSNSNSTILIQGESGTGKELFARAIHNASTRKNNPF